MKAEEFFAMPDDPNAEPELDEEVESAEEELPETDPEDAELVEVRMDGRTLRLSPEDAAAIQDFQKRVRDRDGARGGELAQLREQLARLEGQLQATGRTQTVREPEIQPPDPDLALKNFPEYARQYTAYMEGRLAAEKASLETRYEEDLSTRERAAREAAAHQSWADSFYAEHPEFNKPHIRRLVAVIYQENKTSIDQETSPRAQRERLASLSEEALSELVTTSSEREAGARPPKVAGQRSKAAAPKKSEADEKPITLAAKSKEIRAKLRGRAA